MKNKNIFEVRIKSRRWIFIFGFFFSINDFGFDSLKDANGDFAGAIYSKKSDSFTLFRDHTGVRPLFYYADRNLFAFSTDIRGITAIPETDTAINEKFFYESLSGYFPLTLDKTDYQNIYCILPAHYYTVHVSNEGFHISTKEYWRLGSKKIRFKTDKF